VVHYDPSGLIKCIATDTPITSSFGSGPFASINDAMNLAEDIGVPKSIGNVKHLEEHIACATSQRKKGKYATKGLPIVKHVILLPLEEKDDDMSGASEMPGLMAQTPPNSGWLLPPLLPNEETNASLKEEASKPESWSNYSNLPVKVTPSWDDDTISLGDDVSSLFGDYEGTSGIQDLIQDDDGYAPHLTTLSSNNFSHTVYVLTKADIGSISKYLCTCPSIAACKCKGCDQFPFWMLDSGSSSHFTLLKSDFADYKCHRQATVSHRFQIGFCILMPVRLVPLRTYRLKRLSRGIT
jgi:hypothetical protein